MLHMTVVNWGLCSWVHYQEETNGFVCNGDLFSCCQGQLFIPESMLNPKLVINLRYPAHRNALNAGLFIGIKHAKECLVASRWMGQGQKQGS